MSNFFAYARVYGACESAKGCASLVELSPSTHICTNIQYGQYLCSVSALAYRTPGKQSHFWDNSTGASTDP